MLQENRKSFVDSNIIEEFPGLQNKLKLLELGLRPKKLPKNLVISLMEELYTQQYENATKIILNRDKLKAGLTFAEFVFEYYTQIYRNPKLTCQNFINLLYSISSYKFESEEVSLFYQFLKKADSTTLLFFLFVRGIVEKQLGIKFYSMTTKDCHSLNSVKISRKQLIEVLSKTFGSEEYIDDYLKNIDQIIKTVRTITVFSFLTTVLTIYETKLSSSKKFDLFLFSKSENIQSIQNNSRQIIGDEKSGQNPDPIDKINSKPKNVPNGQKKIETESLDINENLFEFLLSIMNQVIEIFLEEVYQGQGSNSKISKENFKIEIFPLLSKKSSDLLRTLVANNKVAWFAALLIKLPNEIQLSEVEELQLLVRRIRKSKPHDKEIAKELCFLVLQTPEFYKEIVNLLKIVLNN